MHIELAGTAEDILGGRREAICLHTKGPWVDGGVLVRIDIDTIYIYIHIYIYMYIYIYVYTEMYIKLPKKAIFGSSIAFIISPRSRHVSHACTDAGGSRGPCAPARDEEKGPFP